jgi:uncharacterized protein (DUF433 family)/DNA-binding transcriptional MerR regulator
MNYFGKGIYTVSTASKILKINPQKIRRWINGYTYQKNMEQHSSKPLVKTDFKYDQNDVIISFLDLLELLFINTFIQYGVNIRKIRQAVLFASKTLNTSHPFAIKKIYTDGKSIFARMAKEENDTSLINLINRQFQLDKIVEPTLFECIDFNKYDQAEKWWPMGKGKNIVLDPARNFGQPILNSYNIRTELIFDLYKSNHSIEEIREWYEVDNDSIRSAIDFEKGFVA